MFFRTKPVSDVWIPKGLTMKPPNILLIMTDQQRRDCISANSGRWVETPNVDRLAQEGVNYRRAYATCPICIPSRFTLLAGDDSPSGSARKELLLECGYYPATVTAICTEQWKYIHHMNGGFEELYDRETDPEERHNLAESQASRAREMRAALVALIRKEGAHWYLQGDDLRSIFYDPRYNYYTGQRLPAPGTAKP